MVLTLPTRCNSAKQHGQCTITASVRRIYFASLGIVLHARNPKMQENFGRVCSAAPIFERNVVVTIMWNQPVNWNACAVILTLICWQLCCWRPGTGLLMGSCFLLASVKCCELIGWETFLRTLGFQPASWQQIYPISAFLGWGSAYAYGVG